jgi:hypothetical protein
MTTTTAAKVRMTVPPTPPTYSLAVSCSSGT